MKQARELGINARFYGINKDTSPNFINGAGLSLEGTIITTWSPPRTQQYFSFIEKYNLKFGRMPNFEVSLFPTYDIGKFIAQEMLKPSQDDFILKIKNSLLNMRMYKGLSGEITVDPDGACRSLKTEKYMVFTENKFIDYH